MKKSKIIHKQLIVYFFVFALLILSGSIYYNFKSNKFTTLTDKLNSWGIKLAKSENYKIGNPKEVNRNTLSISAKSGENILKIEHLTDFSNNDKQSFIKNELLSIDSLFKEMPAPYPDMITQTIVCPEKYKPKIETKENEKYKATYYEMYAGERFNYGVCSEDIISFYAIYSLIDIKNKLEVYQIEIFTPKSASQDKKDELKNIIRSFDIK